MQSEYLEILSAAFLPMAEGVIILDPDTHVILSINPKMILMTGYSSEEVLGKDFSVLLPDSKSIYRVYDVYGKESESKKVLWQLRSKSGNILHIDFALQVLESKSSQEQYVVFYVRDRTETRSLEIEILFTQNLLKAIREIKQSLFLNQGRKETLENAVFALQKSRNFDLVWGVINSTPEQGGDSSPFIFTFSWENPSNRYLETRLGNWIRESQKAPINLTLNDPQMFVLFHSSKENTDFKDYYKLIGGELHTEAICIQISWNGKIYGALELLYFNEFPFTEDDIHIIQELGSDLGYAFYTQDVELIKADAIKQIEYQGLVLDNIEVPILSMDRFGKINYANLTAEKDLQFEFSEMRGHNASQFLGLSQNTIQEMQTRSLRREVYLQNPRIRGFIGLVNSSPIIGSGGEFLGVLIVLFDLTEQKEQENRIKNSESKLRNFFANLNNGIVIVNETGKILEIAPVLKFHLFQYLNLDVEDSVFEFLQDSTKLSLQATLEKCTQTLKVESREFMYPLLGRDTYFSVRIIPLKKYLLAEKAAMLIFSDITETRNLNRLLVESAKFASIGELAAGIAHEINNPLQSALLYLEDLIQVDESDPNERKKILERIESANLRIRDLVRNLLDLGRTQSTEKEFFPPETILNRAIELLEAGCRKKGIQVVRRISPGLPKIWVRWQEIEQVLINCIMNSMNALSEMNPQLPNPSIIVSLRPESYLNRDWVAFSIEDNGPGLSKEMMEKAFLPFFTTRRTKQGTGLGLSISKKIVTDHFGEIEFDPSISTGSRIFIRIPITDEFR
jgi:PAS domain S-box-containing protein